MDAPTKRILIIGGTALGLVLVASFALYFLYGQKLQEQGSPRGQKPVEYERVPPLRWTNSQADDLKTHDMVGRVWCGYFFFASCRGICIPMTQAAARMQEEVAKIPGAQIVGITCDPDEDTPEILHAYAQQHGLDSKVVQLWRGDFDAVQRFAQEVLFLGLERADEKQLAAGAEKIMHSSRFFVVDENLQVHGTYDGLEPDKVDELIRHMQRLAKAAAQRAKK